MAPDFSWIRRLTDCTELMDEVLPGDTIIEVIGEGRVLIEGHHGVTEYGEEKICVKTRLTVVEITGCNLKLSNMTSNKLIVTGEISSVQLQRGTVR